MPTPRPRWAPGACPSWAHPDCWRWCEAATCAAIDPGLAAGETSVGTRIQLEHLAPSAVGQEVEVTARLAYVDGRLRRFSVAARNIGPEGAGKLIGSGEITRVVVDGERFLAPITG